MPATKNQSRERLDALRERKGEARERVNTAREAVVAAQSARDRQAEQVASSDLAAAWDEMKVAEGLELALLNQMSGIGREMGQGLANNLDAQRVLQEIAASSAPLRSNVHVGDLIPIDEVVELTGRALHAAPVDVPNSGGGTAFLGIAPTPQPPTSLLDFFASVPFQTRTADLMRRSGVADAAIQVAGAIKHEASLVYTPDSIRAITIAAWVKANRQDLDDISALLPDIREALRYGTLVKVEDLLLNGAPADADGPAVPGILDNPFVPTITATNLADAIGQAKAQLISSGVQPNFAAANPATIEDEEERTGSDGHYVRTIDDQGRVRRLPLVESVALGDGEVVLGDSRVAARLGVRQGISLIAGQESDDLVRNRVTVLVEGRWTPLVAVPTAVAHFSIPVAS